MEKTNFTIAGINLKNGFHSTFYIFIICLFSAFNGWSQECTLACSGANISVDVECGATLNIDMFLNGEQTSCMMTDSFAIIIQDHHSFEELFRDTFHMDNMPFENTVYWEDAGELIGEQVKVIIREADDRDGPKNSCWTYSLIEDKLDPIIECPTDTVVIPCCPPAVFDITLFDDFEVDDCSNPNKIELNLVDQIINPNDCQMDPDSILKYISRVYVAVDEFDNSSEPCTLTVGLERLYDEDMSMFPTLNFPDSLTILPGAGPPVDCDEVGNDYDDMYADVNEDGIPDASPEGAGIPWFDKEEIPNMMPDEGIDLFVYPLNSGHPSVQDLIKYCSVGASYEDVDLGTIKCVRKIMRMWTMTEWFCGDENVVQYIQLIEIVDDEGPVLDVPHDFEASTNGYTCEAMVFLPAVEGEDNCSEIHRIDLRIVNFGDPYLDMEEEGMPIFYQENWTGGTVKLPEGRNEVHYIGFDVCHNDSTFIVEVIVKDHTPPVAICDEHTVVSLTNEGTTTMPAKVLDDGSYDDCGLKKMVALRMDPGCDCEEHYPKFDGFHFMGSYEDHYYYISHDSFPGYKAFSIAEALGGYVASIGNGAEDDWIYDEVHKKFSGIDYLIGLSDHEHEGFFEWHSGEPFIYENWDGGEPDFLDSDDEDFVFVRNSNGYWATDEGHERYRFVLEIVDPCGWSEYVDFCCDDLGTPQMVSFRAIDKWGNYNDCMVEVIVQDKVPPFLICPPDMTIACEFDYEDLNAFGKVVQGQEARESIHIPEGYLFGVDTGDGILEPGDQGFPPPLWDGYTTDNCDVIIEEDTTDLRDQCGFGLLIRTFKAYTIGGIDTSTCWQFLTFESKTHFDKNNVVFPPDTLIEDCDVIFDTRFSLPPDEFGRPVFIDEDECDLVGASFEDHVFYFNDTDGESCFKVIRKWKIIDWCQVNYNRENHVNSQEGYMEYPQIIKVINTVDPEFVEDCQDRTFCVEEPDCDAVDIMMMKSATDDCTTDDSLRWEIKIDLDNDGYYDEFFYEDGQHQDFGFEPVQYGAKADASGRYPLGEHAILWTVEDLCGNKISCEEIFIVENCKAPIAACLALAVDLMPMDFDGDGDPDTAMLEIWASDFAAPSPQLCDADVIHSFDEDLDSLSRTFTCDDLGLPQPIDVHIYFSIITASGDTVSSWCETTIEIQDNMGNCSGSGTALLSVGGQIGTENLDMVSNVQVDMQGSEFSPVMTDQDGAYAFPLMPQGGTYAVVPDKNDDPMNGVSTLDLVLIQKHILGLEMLNSPYKIIAADINKDQTVSALDLVELRKLILGVYGEFPENKSWRFVDKSYQFENMEKPLLEGFPEEYNIDYLEQDMVIDFNAIKVGDVNHSLEINGRGNTEVRNRESTLVLQVSDAVLNTASVVSIPVRIEQTGAYSGFQFTLEYDVAALRYVGVQPGSLNLTEGNLGLNRLEEGQITVSWNMAEATTMNAGDQLFVLTFQSRALSTISQTMRISSAVTAAEAYDASNEVVDVELTFAESLISDNEQFALYQNTPNPFSVSTEIAFHLPQSTMATISIHNVSGQLVKKIEANYGKGMNTLIVDQKDLGRSGIYYYTLETETFSATKRLVVIR